MNVSSTAGLRDGFASDVPHLTDTPLARALRRQESFTREQLAWCIAQAFRSGYECRDEEDRGFHAGYLARVAEENATYPPEPLLNAQNVVTGISQRERRRQFDRIARVPRIGDHLGGPVETWGDGDIEQVAA